MAGGRGSRMGSLTEATPKPLVEVSGKTILQRKLERYIGLGFRRFVICIGYLGEKIKRAIEEMNLDAQFVFSDAGEKAGILKRLHFARPDLTDRIVMTYGDTFTDLNFVDLLQAHQGSRAEATIVTASIQNPFGLVDMEEGLVTYFKEKPLLNYYIGYAAINRSALDLAPPAVVELPDGEGLVTFYKILIALGKLGAYRHQGRQITFNTRDELREAEENLGSFYTDKGDP